MLNTGSKARRAILVAGLANQTEKKIMSDKGLERSDFVNGG